MLRNTTSAARFVRGATPAAPGSVSARLGIRRAAWLLPVVALGLPAGPAAAQEVACVLADPVFLAEGPVSAIEYDSESEVGYITSMDVRFLVPPGTPVETPTNPGLGMAGFADETSFPNRTQPGFIGATVQAQGCVKFEGGEPYAVAEHVFSDVNEHVMLGVVTADLVEGKFGVNEQPVHLLADERMPNEGVFNTFGFEVDPASVAQGAAVGIEGYYANDGSGILHVWDVEVAGGTLADTENPQVSIARFRCGADLEIRGAVYLGTETCTLAAPWSLAVFIENRAIPTSRLSTFNGVAPDLEFCTYQARSDEECPDEVTVTLLDGGSPVTGTSERPR
jgi:hypothetical protein